MNMDRDVVFSLTSVHSIEIAIEVSEFYTVDDFVSSWMELSESINVVDIICKDSYKLCLTFLEFT